MTECYRCATFHDLHGNNDNQCPTKSLIVSFRSIRSGTYANNLLMILHNIVANSGGIEYKDVTISAITLDEISDVPASGGTRTGTATLSWKERTTGTTYLCGCTSDTTSDWVSKSTQVSNSITFSSLGTTVTSSRTSKTLTVTGSIGGLSKSASITVYLAQNQAEVLCTTQAGSISNVYISGEPYSGMLQFSSPSNYAKITNVYVTFTSGASSYVNIAANDSINTTLSSSGKTFAGTSGGGSYTIRRASSYSTNVSWITMNSYTGSYSVPANSGTGRSATLTITASFFISISFGGSTITSSCTLATSGTLSLMVGSSGGNFYYGGTSSSEYIVTLYFEAYNRSDSCGIYYKTSPTSSETAIINFFLNGNETGATETWSIPRKSEMYSIVLWISGHRAEKVIDSQGIILFTWPSDFS